VHCLSQSSDFLFLFFLTAILVPKKRKETKMWMSFSAEKSNAKKNLKKKVFSGAEKKK